MKIKIIVPVLLLVLFSELTPGQQWKWVNPYPTGDQINSCLFINASNGFIAGNNGCLFRTIDGGTSWESIPAPMNVDFTKILFNDDLHGWILGSYLDLSYNSVPFLLKTTDGGILWDTETITDFALFTDIFFIDNLTGWCIGYGGKFFKTTDGGTTWINKSFLPPHNADFYSVKFINEYEGFLTGSSSPYVLPDYFITGYTLDGGENWSFGVAPQVIEGAEFKMDMVYDSTLIIAGKNGIILKSEDKSHRWSFGMNNPADNLYALDFLNTGTGIAGADSGYFLKSSDAGMHWSRFNTGIPSAMTSVQCLSQNFFTAAGHDDQLQPVILTSSNAGAEWTDLVKKISNPISVWGIAVLDDQTVYISGNELNYGDGYIYKTTDGGTNWTQSYLSSSNEMHEISSPYPNMVFAVAQTRYTYENMFLKSTDGGQNWSSQVLGTGNSLNWISVPDPQTIYCASEYIIYKSIDNGVTWDTVYQAQYPLFSDMQFLTADLGFAISRPAGDLYKTTDGGESWNQNNIAQDYSLCSIYFLSENIGYAFGGYNLYRTIDGGLTWSNIYSSNSQFLDLVFNDEMNGWAVCDFRIYSTTDSGITWERDFATYPYLTHLGFRPHVSLWTAGIYCSILKYNTPLPSSITIGQNLNLPAEFALLQNYPNPFNPSTTIRYDIPQASQVTIKIFDALGAESAVLLNEFKQPGRYTVEWNAKKFASGVYYYTIKAANFVQTKKMILLK